MTDKTMVQVPGDSPLMLAWNEYKRGPDYANTKNWATKPEHTDGSLWAAFSAGFNATPPESGGQGEAVAWRWPGGHWQDGTPTQVERDELFRAGKEPEYAYGPQPSAAVTEAAVDKAVRFAADARLADWLSFGGTIAEQDALAALSQGGRP